MPTPSDLDFTLLKLLLDEQLEKFRLGLEAENPGLSRSERQRYLRAARLFVDQLLGGAPKTHGREPRPTKRRGA